MYSQKMINRIKEDSDSPEIALLSFADMQFGTKLKQAWKGSKDQQDGLDYALGKLTAQKRLFLNTIFFSDMTAVELASLLGIRTCTVTTTVIRALRDLCDPGLSAWITNGFAKQYNAEETLKRKYKKMCSGVMPGADKVPLEDLHLSTLAYTALIRAGYKTLEDIIPLLKCDKNYSDLPRDFGTACLADLRKAVTPSGRFERRV